MDVEEKTTKEETQDAEDVKTNEGIGQQLEQERSNAERARQQAEQAQAELDDTKSELQTKQEELEKARDKLEEYESKTKFGELDPLVDESIKKSISELREEVVGLKGTVKTLNKEIEVRKQEAAEAKAQAAHNKRVEKVLTTTEKLGDFPVKYRTEALKIADDLVDSGKETRPDTAEDGIILMTKCYKMAIEKSEKKKKSSTPTDSGAGGIAFQETDFKEGSHDDVLTDMKTSGRYKGASLPEPE